jgi:Tfp pilus assembly protein PilO
MLDEMKKRQRIVNIAGAAVIVFGIAAPAAFGIVKLFAHGRQSISDAAELGVENSKLDELGTVVQQKEIERKQSEMRLAAAESRLPSSQEMDLFMQQLAKVASEAGLQIDSTMPGKGIVETGGYKAARVDITGVGDWDTCYRFLTGLKAMDRLTRLDTLTLEIDAEKSGGSGQNSAFLSGKPVCRISLGISTFMAR